MSWLQDRSAGGGWGEQLGLSSCLDFPTLPPWVLKSRKPAGTPDSIKKVT